MPRAPLPDLFVQMSRYTDECLGLFGDLAQNLGVYIVGGSQFKRVGDAFYNTAHLFTPAGESLEQRKCHVVPLEKAVATQVGNGLAVFATEKVKVSILICYDLEFPEAARLVTLRGAEIILSPSATVGRLATGVSVTAPTLAASRTRSTWSITVSSAVPAFQGWNLGPLLDPNALRQGLPGQGHRSRRALERRGDSKR